jgi:DNA repair photolyase
MLSGNTDCYQPAERKYKITQAVLNVLYEYKHPVSIITKNALIERDIALLADMAKLNLVHVNFSLTTLDEKLKRVLEPRTASVRNALRTIQSLSENGIPVNVLMAPIIPNLNDHEILPLVKEVAAHGAQSMGYTIVRLNGVLPQLFEDWVVKNYPMKAAAVLDKIKEIHGGTMNDNRFGTRMRGEGKNAEMIRTQFAIARKKYLSDRTTPALDFSLFSPKGNGQLKLF